MKIRTIEARKILIVMLAVIVAAGALFLGRTQISYVMTAASPKRDLPIYNVSRDDNFVALSFDAAWAYEKAVTQTSFAKDLSKRRFFYDRV